MSSIKIEELLAELEGAEKTAEEAFISGVTKEDEAPAQEEKVAEETSEAPKADEAPEAPKEEEEAVKEASADEEQKRALVKQAEEYGKIAAHSFFAELVALGVMPPTNKDFPVPPISAISLPSESPVTMKADAKEQIAAGHDGYDKRLEKKASVITPEFLTKFHNKLYSEE